MVRKRTGRVQFLALLRLWTGPPQNNNNNNHFGIFSPKMGHFLRPEGLAALKGRVGEVDGMPIKQILASPSMHSQKQSLRPSSVYRKAVLPDSDKKVFMSATLICVDLPSSRGTETLQKSTYTSFINKACF